MFVGVGNDLPAVLPLASPRLKILMVPHWCCSDTPGSVPGGSVFLENSCSREIGGKNAWGFLVKSKMKIEVRNEDWPPGSLSQRLKICTRP